VARRNNTIMTSAYGAQSLHEQPTSRQQSTSGLGFRRQAEMVYDGHYQLCSMLALHFA